MTRITRAHQVQGDRTPSSETHLGIITVLRDRCNEAPFIVAHHPNHNLTQLIRNSGHQGSELRMQGSRHVQVPLDTFGLQQLTEPNCRSDTAYQGLLLGRHKRQISSTHLVAMNLSPVSIPTHVRQVHIAISNRFPCTERRQRPTPTIRRNPPRLDRTQRNRPRIAEPDTRKVPGNHKLAHTLGRNTKQRRCIRKGKKVRSHANKYIGLLQYLQQNNVSTR